jgi:16S rRNA G966 N2-methylase RsmD
LCLLDPPYSLTDRVVAGVGALLAPLMTSSGTVVIEHSAALSPPDPSGLEIASRTDRTYGDTAVSVIRLGASS